jgi:hypothetical protein
MPVEIPKVTKRVDIGGARLTGKISPGIATPIVKGLEAQAQATESVARAVRDATGLTVSALKDRQKKAQQLNVEIETNKAYDAYHEDFVELETLHSTLSTAEDRDKRNLSAEFNAEIQKLKQGRLEELSPESLNKYNQLISSSVTAWNRDLIKTQVTAVKTKAIYRDNVTLDTLSNATRNFNKGKTMPSDDMLLNAISNMDLELDETQFYEPDQREKLKEASRDKLVKSYFEGMEPLTAFARLDGGEHRDLFLDEKSFNSFRKMIKTRSEDRERRSEKERTERVDKTFSDWNIRAAQVATGDPNATPVTIQEIETATRTLGFNRTEAQAAVKILDTQSKTAKDFEKDQRENEWAESVEKLLAGDAAEDFGNAWIVENISDADDRIKFMNLRDKIFKEDNTVYRKVLSDIKKDYDKNAFGKGAEGTREYHKQVRGLVEWVEAGGKPEDYYAESVKEIAGTGFWDSIFGRFDKSETAKINRLRIEAERKGLPSFKAFSEQPNNQGKSDTELITDYETMVSGRVEAITLPNNITKTSEAKDYLMKNEGMTEPEAINWLRSQ